MIAMVMTFNPEISPAIRDSVVHCLHLTICLTAAISSVDESWIVFFNSRGTFMPKNGVLLAAPPTALWVITCTADIFSFEYYDPAHYGGPRLLLSTRAYAHVQLASSYIRLPSTCNAVG